MSTLLVPIPQVVGQLIDKPTGTKIGNHSRRFLCIKANCLRAIRLKTIVESGLNWKWFTVSSLNLVQLFFRTISANKASPGWVASGHSTILVSAYHFNGISCRPPTSEDRIDGAGLGYKIKKIEAGYWLKCSIYDSLPAPSSMLMTSGLNGNSIIQIRARKDCQDLKWLWVRGLDDMSCRQQHAAQPARGWADLCSPSKANNRFEKHWATSFGWKRK